MNRTPDEIKADETAQSDGCDTHGRDTSLYGGQAVIEGVLMKGRYRAVVACRNPQGKIVSKVLFEDPEGKSAGGMRRIPFLRGFLILWDSLSLGLKALSFSADVAIKEEEKTGNDKAADGAIETGGDTE